MSKKSNVGITWLRNAFSMQRHAAGKRGIQFYLTFDEWLEIWEKSGKLSQRGRCRGQYVMARKGDKGAYEVGNVRIITVVENHHEYHLDRPLTESHRANLSESQKDKFFSKKTRKRMSIAAKKKVMSAEHCQRISDATAGILNPNAAFRDMRVIEEIREQYATGNFILADLAKKYCVCGSTISNICRGYNYK